MRTNYPSLVAIATSLSAACGPVPETVVDQATAPADVEAITQAATNETSPAFESLKNDAKTIADFASKLGSAYSTAKTGIEILQFLEILPAPPSQEELFDRVHRRIDELGLVLTNQNVRISRAERLGTINAADSAADRAIREGRPIDGTQAFQAHAATDAQLDRVFHERQYIAKAFHRAVGAPVVSGNMVYDWRLGVPHLMRMVAVRLKVLKALNGDWRYDPTFRGEVEKYRLALRTHYDQIVGGVRCAVHAGCGNGGFSSGSINGSSIVCGDVYTNETRTWGDLACSVQPYHRQIAEDFKNELLFGTPAFELKKMIDSIELALTARTDLTERLSRIPAVAPTALCMDVQWGGRDSGTPLWLWPCTGDGAQHWVYNRVTGEIRNPTYGKCLDVQWGSRRAGAPVWTWDCTGDPAQQWTFDLRSGTLQSAVNPNLVLSASGGHQQADLTMQAPGAWPVQQWHVDTAGAKRAPGPAFQ